MNHFIKILDGKEAVLKIIDKIIAVVSIVLGFFLIVDNYSIYHDYKVHPNILRLIMYPESHLIIMITIGFLLIIGGILLLFNSKLSPYPYLIIGYYLTIKPIFIFMHSFYNFSELMPVLALLLCFLYYFGISIPIIVYFNHRRFKTARIKNTSKNINILILILSVLIHVAIYSFYGEYSIIV